MNDLNSDFLVGDLFKRLLNSFNGALNVSLDDDGKLLHFALGDLAEEVIKSNLLILLEYFFLCFVLSLLDKFSCQFFISNGVEDIACRGNFRKTRNLNGNGGACLLNKSALVVGHRSYTADSCTCDDNVARS